MKPKFRISEIVRIKATGEKVKIIGIWERYPLFEDEYYLNSHVGYTYKESKLKPYRPSRTGKYRNKRGQFRSENHDDFYKDMIKIAGISKYLTDSVGNKTATEVSLDSKQRNYQKILTTLDRIEKKIDELGRRV